MGRPVVHFEIMGEDGAALQAFYAALFDWRYDTTHTPHGYALVDGTGGIGGGVAGLPGYRGHVTVYVDVPDIEAALQHAKRLGGQRVMGPEPVTDSIVVGQFLDPQGNLVGLVTSTSARIGPEERSGTDA